VAGADWLTIFCSELGYLECFPSFITDGLDSHIIVVIIWFYEKQLTNSR